MSDETTTTDDQQILAIWRSVLRQAIHDAVGASKPLGTDGQTSMLAREQAQAWFRANSQDYRDVCVMADVDADTLRTNVLQLIDAGDALYLAPTKGDTHMLRRAEPYQYWHDKPWEPKRRQA